MVGRLVSNGIMRNGIAKTKNMRPNNVPDRLEGARTPCTESARTNRSGIMLRSSRTA